MKNPAAHSGLQTITGPVRFSPVKHHRGFLRQQLYRWPGLSWAQVRDELAEMGSNQFDVYTGPLEVGEVVAGVERLLREGSIYSREQLRLWLEKTGYHVLELNDGSRWVVRESDEGESYAHLYPARNQPLVTRLKANHVKTAVALLWRREPILADENSGVVDAWSSDNAFSPSLTSAGAKKNKGQDEAVFFTRTMNRVRKEMLGLSPVRSAMECSRILATLRFLFPGQRAE